MILKTCSRCSKEQPLDNFYISKTSSDGHRSWCKECVKNYTRSLYHTNPEYRKNQIQLNNYENSKERQQKYFKSQKGKDALKKYHQSDKGKKAIRRANRKANKTEKRKKLYRANKARRKRDLKWISFMDNPFPDDVEVDWHHINDLIVIPLPRKLHQHNLGVNHRSKCNNIINQIYGIDEGLFNDNC